MLVVHVQARGGGTVAHELTSRGVKVVVLEAGPYLTQDDWLSDEWPAFAQMAWLNNRTASGSWRVATDFPNLPTWIVKAVSGTTTHWVGATPRLMAHEFRVRSVYGDLDGVDLLDWPITLDDVEPWYERAEQAMGASHRRGRPPLPADNNYKVFANGAEPYDGRPGSIQDGFNFQGDKNGSKWSTLVREIPRSLATGNLDLRPQCQAVRTTHDSAGKADAVDYVHAEENLHRQAARVVCVAGNSIDSLRLLLMSTSSLYPDGLGNSSGQVGRNYMRHTTGSAYARFDKPVHMYRGETMAGLIADEARHDPSRGFSGGYFMETLALGPAFLASFIEPGASGREFTELMDAYECTAGMWIVGEDMPQSGDRVTLSADVTDELGLPVPHVNYDDHPNDVAMRNHTCRMSADPADGVVDRWGRAHDVPNPSSATDR